MFAHTPCAAELLRGWATCFTLRGSAGCCGSPQRRGPCRRAAAERERSQLFTIQHNIMTLGEIARSLLPCTRERLTPDGLLPFGLWRTTGARSVWTSKSSLHVMYLFWLSCSIIQCFVAGVRWWRSGQRVAAGPGVWRPACGHKGRLFVSAQGHLVSGAQVLLGHVGVGRKWPHKSLGHTWYFHPCGRGSDGVWATLRRSHPSRGCIVGERYQRRWLSDEPNSIYRWTSKRFFQKIGDYSMSWTLRPNGTWFFDWWT